MSAGPPEPPGGARPLLIFPCNGNALEALDCLGSAFRLIGFVDDSPEKLGCTLHGHKVFSRAALADWPDALVLAVPGSPTSFRGRGGLINSLALDPARFARVVHPSARVSPLASLGRNVLVMAGTAITSNAVIGDHVCILPNTVIHHDVRIGDRTLIGSNVTVAGGVEIGPGCYLGSGCSVMNGLTIGAGAFIGIGSTVIRPVSPGATVAGNPARPLG